MNLWTHWWTVVCQLRPACSRMRTFLWLSACLMGLTIRLKIHPSILRANGRLLIVGDGIKAPKSGKKMPAIKLFHQASESNTKPTYIPFFIGPGQWEQLAGWNRCPLGVPR